MSTPKDTFEMLLKSPDDDLCVYLTDADHSFRKHMAAFVLQRRLQDRDNELEIARLKAANAELEPRLKAEEKWKWINFGLALLAAIAALGAWLLPRN